SKTNSWFGQQTASQQAKIVFVFSGQGVSMTGVGRELYDAEPAFRAAIDECEEAIRARSGHSVKQILLSTENSGDVGTDLTQLALFAMQVGLAKLWRHWGIGPTAVIGHSIGEVAAAHAAGVLSLADAVRVVSARGSLMQQAVERDGQPGAMVAVDLSCEQAEQLLADHQNRIVLAAHNSPTSVILSGDATALKQLVPALELKGIVCRWLHTNQAFHSPAMDPLRLPLEGMLRDVG